MIDFLHLPKPQNGYVDYFPGYAATLTTSWQVWNKPRGVNFVKIITIGGGGGGNRGISSATTNARGGSGGGGSGGIATIMMPAIFLPDRLYVSAGAGGRRGTSLGNGTDGGISYVSIAPSTAIIYLVCYANGGASGTIGAPTGGGGGGSGGSQAVTGALQSGQGNFTTLTGQSGSAGGGQLGANGTNIIYPTTGLLLSGGAGGAGGAGFVGGDITAPASQTDKYTIFPTLPGGVAGSVSSLAGGDGVAGINNMELLLFSGGSGGGSGFDGTAGSVGGAGGNGGFGCGGGGGGGGTTGGEGGNGGPGLVIISSW
jgi:hypothetical protein